MEKGYKNRIITISGDPASGKGTVSKALKKLYEAQGLEVEIVSVGEKFREISLKEYMKMFPDAVNPSQEEIQNDPAFAEKLKEIDLKLDSIIADTGKDINSKYRPGKVFIIDSRLAWHTIPDSFSVRLTVDEKTAGERVFQDKKRKKQERGSTIQEAIEDTASRRRMEIERYLAQYGVDITNPDNYKLIIDTTLTSLEDVPDIAKVIQMCEERFQKGQEYCKTWTSPKLFYPSQDEEQK